MRSLFGLAFYLWLRQCGAGFGDCLAGVSLKAAAENEPCHLSESSSNSNGACAFSLLNLQPSAWTPRRFNSGYSENIMAPVIVLFSATGTICGPY